MCNRIAWGNSAETDCSAVTKMLLSFFRYESMERCPLKENFFDLLPPREGNKMSSDSAHFRILA